MPNNTVRRTAKLAAVCLLTGCGAFNDKSRIEAGEFIHQEPPGLGTVTDGLSATESCFAEKLSSLPEAKPTLLVMGPWTAVKPALKEVDTYFAQTIMRAAPEQYRLSETENVNIGLSGYIMGSEMVWAPVKLTKEQIDITLKRNDVSAMRLVTATVLTDQSLTSHNSGAAGALEFQKENREGTNTPALAIDIDRSDGRSWDSMNMTVNISDFDYLTGADFIAGTFELQAVRQQGSKNSALTVGFGDALTLTVGGVVNRQHSQPLITGVQRQLTRMAALEFLRQQFPEIPLQNCFNKRLDSHSLADGDSGRAGDDQGFNQNAFSEKARPIAEFLVSRHLMHPQATSQADLLKAINDFEYLVDELPTRSLDTPELLQLRLEALEQRFNQRLEAYRQASQTDPVVSQNSASLNIDVTEWRQGKLNILVYDHNGAVITGRSFALPPDRDLHKISWTPHSSSNLMTMTLTDGPVAVRHWNVVTNRRSGS